MKTYSSQPLLLCEVLRAGTKALNGLGIESARLDMLLLLEHTLGKNRSWILARQNEYNLTPAQLEQLEISLNRRLSNEPIAYIVGHCEFYGLNLIVDKNTLIPRPETEDMVNLALKSAPQNGKLHDLGTGSGAVAIAIKYNRSDLRVSASDISSAALKVAKANINNYSSGDIGLYTADLMDDINEKFDLITANLPYIPSGRSFKNSPVAHEPERALYSGNDGLDHYKKLFTLINLQLNPGGLLIIEAEPDQHQALIRLARQNGLELDQQVRLTLSFRIASN